MYTVKYKVKEEIPKLKALGYYSKRTIEPNDNIESLTISKSDIMNFCAEDRSTIAPYFLSFYASVTRDAIDNGIRETYTIKNDDSRRNWLITAIMNCDWLINADSPVDDYDELLKTAESELKACDEKIEDSKDGKFPFWCLDRKQLVEYYIKTLNLKRELENNQTISAPSLVKTRIGVNH
jgi:hypothetical protein